ncbi:putative Zn(2)-C6 fungal-type domain-containing protein [Seiridium cardinale]|uniref:Zn(2)-C6 fungal-type domain-containing protein n=1 Tax=Seiridium cardinale TaxID=138064 RepID=A0ABR2XVB3_9PEZI
MSSDACWACKDRKVRCDRLHPQCSRCTQADRDCQYGLRLSWPKAGNNRRVLKHLRPGTAEFGKYPESIRFVNAKFWDIRLHHFISSSSHGQGQFHSRGNLFRDMAVPPPPRQLVPYHLDERKTNLLEYFCYNVFSSMGKFCDGLVEFHNILHRLALLDESLSTKAVLEAILALSSLHRHGRRPEAMRLKLSALRTLGISSSRELGAVEGIQHVVAGMLLCYYEVDPDITGAVS